MIKHKIRIMGKFFEKCWKNNRLNFEHIRRSPSYRSLIVLLYQLAIKESACTMYFSCCVVRTKL